MPCRCPCVRYQYGTEYKIVNKRLIVCMCINRGKEADTLYPSRRVEDFVLKNVEDR